MIFFGMCKQRADNVFHLKLAAAHNQLQSFGNSVQCASLIQKQNYIYEWILGTVLSTNETFNMETVLICNEATYFAYMYTTHELMN